MRISLKQLKFFIPVLILSILVVAALSLYFTHGFAIRDAKGDKNVNKEFEALLKELQDPPKNLHEAEKLAKKALKATKIISDSNLIAQTYYELANLFQKTDRNDSTLIYYKKSQRISENCSFDELLVKIYNGKANFYLRNEDYSLAAKELTLALKKAEVVKDKHYTGLIYNGFGIMYVSTKEFDKALEYFKKARDICIEVGDKKNEIGIYFNLANCYAEKSDYEQAQKNYEYLLEYYMDSGDTAQIINTLINMGIVSREMGISKQAIAYFDTANRYFESYNNTSLLSSLKVEIGVYYYFENNFETSEKYLKNGFALAKGTYARTNRNLALKYLSLLEEKRGNAAMALEYYKLYTIAKDSIMNSEIQKRIADIQWKYDFQKKENEHTLLQKRYEIKKTQNDYLITLSALLVIIAVMIVFMVRLSVKNLKNSMKLKELENIQLQERIDIEERINLLDRKRLQSEINAKNAELTATSLQLVQKNETLSDILEKLESVQKKDLWNQISFKEIKSIVQDNLNMDQDWKKFKEVFEKVHLNFFLNLKSQYPTLTENELRFCAFIKSNLQTKQIAKMLNINPSTVIVSRYRIRKKMHLEHGVQLEDILRNI